MNTLGMVANNLQPSFCCSPPPPQKKKKEKQKNQQPRNPRAHLPPFFPGIRIFLENLRKPRENGSGFRKERWLKGMDKASTPRKVTNLTGELKQGLRKKNLYSLEEPGLMGGTWELERQARVWFFDHCPTPKTSQPLVWACNQLCLLQPI